MAECLAYNSCSINVSNCFEYNLYQRKHLLGWLFCSTGLSLRPTVYHAQIVPLRSLLQSLSLPSLPKPCSSHCEAFPFSPEGPPPPPSRRSLPAALKLFTFVSLVVYSESHPNSPESHRLLHEAGGGTDAVSSGKPAPEKKKKKRGRGKQG